MKKVWDLTTDDAEECIICGWVNEGPDWMDSITPELMWYHLVTEHNLEPVMGHPDWAVYQKTRVPDGIPRI